MANQSLLTPPDWRDRQAKGGHVAHQSRGSAEETYVGSSNGIGKHEVQLMNY